MVTVEKSLSQALISLLSSKPRSNYLYIFLLNDTAIHTVLVVKNLSANAGDIRDMGQEDPLEKEMAITPIFLPGESHGQRNLVGYSLYDHKEVGYD